MSTSNDRVDVHAAIVSAAVTRLCSMAALSDES
jgi:hypothetical protein